MRADLWTPERDSILRDAAEAGYGSGKIAVILGVSRNSIVGRARRLGAQLHGNRVVSDKAKTLAAAIDPVPAKPLPPPPPPPTPPPPTPAIVANPPPVEEPPAGGVAIWDLGDRQCHAIVETSDEVRYCGAATLGRLSWCARHRALYCVPTKRQKTLANQRKMIADYGSI